MKKYTNNEAHKKYTNSEAHKKYYQENKEELKKKD